jgi:hypothetical protein
MSDMDTPKPLHTLSDDELGDGLDRTGARVDPAYADYRRELERRASERQARWDRVLVIVGLGIAVVALVVSALRP